MTDTLLTDRPDVDPILAAVLTAETGRRNVDALAARILLDHEQRTDAGADTVSRPTSRTPRARWRRAIRACALAIVLALGAVLVGVHENDGAPGGQRTASPGIAVADARETALAALKKLPSMRDYDVTATLRSTAVRAPHQVYERVERTVRVDGDIESSYRVQNGFNDDATWSALRTRVVDGTTYTESRTRRFKQPWMVGVRDVVTPDRAGDAEFRALMYNAPSDFRSLVEELQSERMVDVRRAGDDGGLTLELRREAHQLAPAPGAPLGGPNAAPDPLSMFAMEIAFTQPHATIDVRIDLADDGTLQSLRTSGEMTTLLSDGTPGGTGRIPVMEDRAWRVVSAKGRRLAAPDPEDVMVVGDEVQTRRGATGPLGPLGSLDSLTRRELEEAAFRAAHTSPPRGPRHARAARPHHRSAAALQALRQRHLAVRNARRLAAAYFPIDRERMSKDTACSPYWPSSGRSMTRSHAGDVEQVGWRCRLRQHAGWISLSPGETTVSIGVGGGRYPTAWIGGFDPSSFADVTDSE